MLSDLIAGLTVADAHQNGGKEPQRPADAAADSPLQWGLRRRSQRQTRAAAPEAPPAKLIATAPARVEPAGGLSDAAPQLHADAAPSEQAQGVLLLRASAAAPQEAQTQVCGRALSSTSSAAVLQTPFKVTSKLNHTQWMSQVVLMWCLTWR